MRKLRREYPVHGNLANLDHDDLTALVARASGEVVGITTTAGMPIRRINPRDYPVAGPVDRGTSPDPINGDVVDRGRGRPVIDAWIDAISEPEDFSDGEGWGIDLEVGSLFDDSFFAEGGISSDAGMVSTGDPDPLSGGVLPEDGISGPNGTKLYLGFDPSAPSTPVTLPGGREHDLPPGSPLVGVTIDFDIGSSGPATPGQKLESALDSSTPSSVSMTKTTSDMVRMAHYKLDRELNIAQQAQAMRTLKDLAKIANPPPKPGPPALRPVTDEEISRRGMDPFSARAFRRFWREQGGYRGPVSDPSAWANDPISGAASRRRMSRAAVRRLVEAGLWDPVPYEDTSLANTSSSAAAGVKYERPTSDDPGSYGGIGAFVAANLADVDDSGF